MFLVLARQEYLDNRALMDQVMAHIRSHVTPEVVRPAPVEFIASLPLHDVLYKECQFLLHFAEVTFGQDSPLANVFLCLFYSASGATFATSVDVSTEQGSLSVPLIALDLRTVYESHLVFMHSPLAQATANPERAASFIQLALGTRLWRGVSVELDRIALGLIASGTLYGSAESRESWFTDYQALIRSSYLDPSYVAFSLKMMLRFVFLHELAHSAFTYSPADKSRELERVRGWAGETHASDEHNAWHFSREEQLYGGSKFLSVANEVSSIAGGHSIMNDVDLEEAACDAWAIGYLVALVAAEGPFDGASIPFMRSVILNMLMTLQCLAAGGALMAGAAMFREDAEGQDDLIGHAEGSIDRIMILGASRRRLCQLAFDAQAFLHLQHLLPDVDRGLAFSFVGAGNQMFNLMRPFEQATYGGLSETVFSVPGLATLSSRGRGLSLMVGRPDGTAASADPFTLYAFGFVWKES